MFYVSADENSRHPYYHVKALAIIRDWAYATQE